MTLKQFRERFIIIFFIVKVGLILLAWFLYHAKAYNANQFYDVFYIIAPAFAANLVIALKYLGKNRKPKKIENEKEEEEEKITKVESSIIIICMIFYGIFVSVELLSLHAEETAFANLKKLIGLAEIAFGGVFGWAFSSFFLDTSTKS